MITPSQHEPCTTPLAGSASCRSLYAITLMCQARQQAMPLCTAWRTAIVSKGRSGRYSPLLRRRNDGQACELHRCRQHDRVLCLLLHNLARCCKKWPQSQQIEIDLHPRPSPPQDLRTDCPDVERSRCNPGQRNSVSLRAFTVPFSRSRHMLTGG